MYEWDGKVENKWYDNIVDLNGLWKVGEYNSNKICSS